MKVADITDIRVTVAPGGGRFVVHFSDAAARYHLWLDAEGAYNWRGLFKNPPRGVELGQPGYYQTRHLNPLTAANNQALKHVLGVIRHGDQIAKAQAAQAEREAERTEAARISALAERRALVNAWGAALAEILGEGKGLGDLTDSDVAFIVERARELGADR